MQLEFWQQIVIIIFTLYAFSSLIFGFKEIKNKNAYGITPQYYFLGSFVWGDALIFGLFWTVTSLTILFLNDWILFLLLFSLFWVVRSIGETIYWFHNQFTNIEKYKLNKMPGYKLVQSDALWFIYQIMNQCITVVTLVTSIYLAALWIKQII